jgi:hypothetical protein
MFNSRVDGRLRILRQGASLLLLLLFAACEGGLAEDVSFDLSIANGGLSGDNGTFVAKQGDTVTLDLASDIHGEVHLHGYDFRTAVGPDVQSSISFVAHATGRFLIEFHPTSQTTTHCDVDVTEMAISLAVEPGTEAGHYVISVETENFDVSLASGNHWHLTSDGETLGMIYDLTTEVDLGMGMHEVMAQLNTGEHCALPVSAVVMVGEASVGDKMAVDNHAGDDSMTRDEHAAEDKHVHESDVESVSIGALEIRPR